VRRWLPYAEAPYYECATETTLSDWLADRNYTMVMARMTSEQNTPMFAVATHNEKKQLLILIRGTMEFADAITDMVGALLLPEMTAKSTAKASKPELVRNA
jgi:hypothetical protein